MNKLNINTCENDLLSFNYFVNKGLLYWELLSFEVGFSNINQVNAMEYFCKVWVSTLCKYLIFFFNLFQGTNSF